MLNISTEIRIKYINALKNNITYNGVVIPIFDEILTADAVIPKVNGAEIYILIENQQEMDYSVQNMCKYTIDANITIRVVTKFSLTGSRRICEDIAKMIDDKIRDGRDNNHLGIRDVKLQLARTLTESSQSHTAYSKVMIYSNILDI